MSKSVELTLTSEMAELAMCALRQAAVTAEERIAIGLANCGFDQPGQLRWLATYIEHKLRDARMPEATRSGHEPGCSADCDAMPSGRLACKTPIDEV